MTVYAWKSAVSGSWNTPTNWNPNGGPVSTPSFFGPVSQDTGLFATGSHKGYTVSGTGVVAREIDVAGDRVTFSAFSVNGSNSDAEFLVEKGANVTFSPDSNFLSITHDGEGGGSIVVDDAKLTVDGQMSAAVASVSNHGTVVVSGPHSNFLALLGGISVDATSTFEVMNGAHIDDSGAFGMPAVTGTIIAIGLGSSFAEYGNPAAAPGIGGGSASEGGSITALGLTGTMKLADGTFSTTTASATARITGYGTVTDPTNDGLITAKGGTLTVTGAVTGTGSFIVADHSTLALDGSSGENIKFTGADGTLMLAPSIGATGFITGFDSSDVIRAQGETLTSVTETRAGANTILHAYAGTKLEDTFQLAGHIPSGGVGVAGDGNGGSIIYLQPVTTTGIMAIHTA